jgi:hypothetical protein
MTRPLYRWKSFWLGVLVIAFLGWAWVGSMHYTESVSFVDGGRGIVATHRPGSIEVLSAEVDPFLSEGLNSSKWPVEAYFRYKVFPAAVSFDPYGAEVAHWFLILLFLLPWSGWLAWRWRKIKRLSTPATQC